MLEKKQLAPAEAAGSIRNLILILTQKQMPEYVELLNPLTDDMFEKEDAAKRLHIELTYAAVAWSTKEIERKLGTPVADAVWQAHQTQVKADDIVAGYAEYYTSPDHAASAQHMCIRTGIIDGEHKQEAADLLGQLINWLSTHPVNVLIKNADVVL